MWCNPEYIIRNVMNNTAVLVSKTKEQGIHQLRYSIMRYHIVGNSVRGLSDE